MQQYLPFTVLKPENVTSLEEGVVAVVATVLTVYGIETLFEYILYQKRYLHVATVLTVYGIETLRSV